MNELYQRELYNAESVKETQSYNPYSQKKSPGVENDGNWALWILTVEQFALKPGGVFMLYCWATTCYCHMQCLSPFIGTA